MITRFRIEAKAHTKEQVISELEILADAVIESVRDEMGAAASTWNITDDVISRQGNVFEGRVVYASKLYGAESGN